MKNNLSTSMYSGFSSLVNKHGPEYAAGFASSSGFSSVEFIDIIGTGFTTFQNTDQALLARRILHKHSLSVSCYSVGANLVNIESGVQKNSETIETLKQIAEIAAALGSPYLHHTLFANLTLPHHAPSFDDVLYPVVEAAREVADYCKGLGISCIYENQGMYFNGVCNFNRFFQLMKTHCDNVGICGDIGNSLFVDEDPLPFFEAFIDHIKHVHLKDYKKVTHTSALRSREGIYLKDVPIGSGDIDIPSCLKALKKHGYCGAFSIEDEFIPELPTTFSYLREHFI